MGTKILLLLLACALALSTLVACGTGSGSVSSFGEQVENTVVADAGPGMVTDEAAQVYEGVDNTGADSVPDAVAGSRQDHEDAEDYSWDSSSVVPIVLDRDSITVQGNGATANGGTVTIGSAGTYDISGSLADGQIIVNTEDQGVVRLILNGVDVNNSAGAAINVTGADKVVIVLADNTDNYISDGDTYTLMLPETDEPNAALFSSADLTLAGNGSLTIDGNYNDGIASKDGLIIAGGTLTVHAVDDGIRGKDYLIVQGAKITVDAGGDGLKSDNAEDAARGYVLIDGGILNVTAGGDAIQAETDVLIADGELTLSSGGGSNAQIDPDRSAKGISAAVSVQVEGGTFLIDSADDAIHSNGSLVVNGGTFALSTGDDAMHADSTVEINGGQIDIIESFEGIESAVITINDGEFHIISSDDGLNIAGGNDGSGTNQAMGPGQRPGRGMGPGQDAFAYSGDYYLYINGGAIVIEAAGDGIDVNGAIEMTGGVVLVNGPTEQMNGALDYDGGFKITGGLLVAVGSAGMAQAPDVSSTQYSLLLNFDGTGRAGTLIHIQTSDGDEILTFSPAKQFQSIAFSSPDLIPGVTYDVYYGGSSTGTVSDGLCQNGTYSAGTKYTSFTITAIVTGLGTRLR